MATVWDYLLDVKQRRGAGYLVLLDPDRLPSDVLERRAMLAAEAGADALMVGTSLMFSSKHLAFYEFLRNSVDVPIISFPGSASHVSPLAHAVLFLSLISGRNPELLIGEQVRAAPLLKEMDMEVISTGYMLVESGRQTSVEFISNTRPVPRDKRDIAMAHALAAEYIGMKTVYLEAGSGALESVPDEMVQAVAQCVSLPLIVGGGIRDPETARRKVEAGAGFIVTGQMVEGDEDQLAQQIRALSAAVHTKE